MLSKCHNITVCNNPTIRALYKIPIYYMQFQNKALIPTVTFCGHLQKHHHHYFSMTPCDSIWLLNIKEVSYLVDRLL